jgi:hypothetical protein
MNKPSDDGFTHRLSDRVSDLRLRADLGEIRDAAALRQALEADGQFRLDDPRVHAACLDAGLGWLVPPAW